MWEDIFNPQNFSRDISMHWLDQGSYGWNKSTIEKQTSAGKEVGFANAA